MKTFSSAAMAEIIAGTAITIGAIEILCDPPLRIWGGPWPYTIAGKEYLGVGDRGMVKTSGASLGAAAQDVTLELSGVDPSALDLLDAEEVRGAPVILRRLVFNGAGTALLDAQVFTRGRIDKVETEETVGGEAIVRGTVEGAARGLRRKGGRMRTDADQRLIKPNDGSFRVVAFAGQKTLYWGGQKPAVASAALGGGGGSSLNQALFANLQLS